MSNLTLSTLRHALTLAHGPAVERLTDRTPAGIAKAYLPHVLRVRRDGGDSYSIAGEVLGRVGIADRARLDLTDPGTVRALPVLLALVLGLDPGPMGLAVSWGRFGRTSWALEGDDRIVFIGADDTDIVAPTIALEPDPVRALTLALQWAIERGP